MYPFLSSSPKFTPGSEVFVCVKSKGYSEVVKTQIRSIPVSYMKLKDKKYLSADGEDYLSFKGLYELDFYYSAIPWGDLCTEKYIYSTREEAEENAKWFSVILTEEEWLTAIGHRDGDDESIEESDLGVCCAVISELRDYLLEVKRCQGVMKIDRDLIKKLAEKHDLIPSPSSSLIKIFNQMEIFY